MSFRSKAASLLIISIHNIDVNQTTTTSKKKKEKRRKSLHLTSKREKRGRGE